MLESLLLLIPLGLLVFALSVAAAAFKGRNQANENARELQLTRQLVVALQRRIEALEKRSAPPQPLGAKATRATPEPTRPAIKSEMAVVSPPPPPSDEIKPPPPRPREPSKTRVEPAVAKVATPPDQTQEKRKPSPSPSNSPSPTFFVGPSRPTRPEAPATNDRAEAFTGGRWATRIGLAFALLGAIFFGVYVGANTTPSMRWAGLAALSGAFLGLGHWRREAWGAYGRALFSGGLAFTFLTALAGYALPATQITDSPSVGWAMQLVAVGLVVGVAAVKREESIALLAGVLGAIAGVFSILLDLSLYTLPYIVGWTLTLTLLGSLRRWDRTRALGLAVGLALLAARLFRCHLQLAVPSEISAYLTVFTLLGMAVVSGLHRDNWESEPWRIGSLTLGSGLLVALLLVEIGLFHSDHLAYTYFVCSAIFSALTIVAVLRKESVALTESWTIKAAILFTLFLVEQFDGGTRVVSLALQGFALIAVWKRRESPWVGGAWMLAGAVTLAAIAYTLTTGLDQFRDAPLACWWIWLSGALLLAQAELTQRFHLWTRSELMPVELSSTGFLPSFDHAFALIVQCLTSGFVLAVHFVVLRPGELGFAAFLGMILFGLAAVALRSPNLAITAGLWGFCSLGTWLVFFEQSSPLSPTLSTGCWLTTLGGLAGASISLSRKPTFELPEGLQKHSATAALAVALIVLVRWSNWALADGWAPILLGGVAFGFSALRSKDPIHAPLLSTFAAFASLGLVLEHFNVASQAFSFSQWAAYAFWAVGLAYFTLVILRPAKITGRLPVVTFWFAQLLYVLAWYVSFAEISPSRADTAIILAGVLPMVFLAPRLQRGSTAPAQIALSLILFAHTMDNVVSQLDTGGIIAWLSLAAAIGWFYWRAVALPKHYPWRIALCALGGVFITIALPFGAGGALESGATAVWGLSGLLTFVLGLNFRRRALRVCGLLTLAAAAGRAFVVDLDQTFERIVAFFALGAVLLVVGFLYHRFAERIGEER